MHDLPGKADVVEPANFQGGTRGRVRLEDLSSTKMSYSLDVVYVLLLQAVGIRADNI